MTSNGIIAFILHFLRNLIALPADYVIVVEDRPIISVKYCLPVPVVHLWPKLTHPAARSLCDSWASCKVLLMGLSSSVCINCSVLVWYFFITVFQDTMDIGHSVVACQCWCMPCVWMCSCSLCSKDLQCWLSFHHHFKSLHSIDMQQCTLCKELVPRGVLMVQHITTKHIRPCSVMLRPAKAKTSKKLGTRKLSQTNKKSSAVASPTCSVSLSRLWTLTFCVKSSVCRMCMVCAFHSRCCYDLCQLKHWVWQL